MGATITTGAEETMISALVTSTMRGPLSQGADTMEVNMKTLIGAEAAATGFRALVYLWVNGASSQAMPQGVISISAIPSGML